MNLKEIFKRQADRVCDMANLYEEDTGVDARIWVSTKYAGHKPRLKVKKDDNEVSLSIEDEPKVLAPKKPKLDTSIINAAKQWIVLNKDILLEYWNDSEFHTKRLYTETKKVK